MKIVFWDKKAEAIEKGKIQQDQTVTISHAYAREGQDGKTELHLGDKGRIKILSDATKKLTEITVEGGPLTVEGTVNTKPLHREVTTSKNEKVAVTSFELRDETGKLKVSAWRDLASTVKDLTVGTRIKMRNVYAKKGYENSIELSSRFSTLVEVLDEKQK